MAEEPITEPVAYPEWSEYREKNGLDPLGMQYTSVNLYQTFLPGISNVTLRMRYYGLYPWLAQRYAKQVGDRAQFCCIVCRAGFAKGRCAADRVQRRHNGATIPITAQ